MRSSQIWDLRTGQISDTIKYDYPITALQFDNRKIVSAAGENGVKVSPSVASIPSAETDFSLRFAGLQPNDTRTQHFIHQRSHCACRATTVHGQIPRNWFKRLYGQSLGFTLRKRRELYLISNSKEHFATPCLLYPFRTPYSSALFTIVTFVKRERE